MNGESTSSEWTHASIPIEGDVARPRTHQRESGIPPQAIAFALFMLAALVLTFMPMLMRLSPPRPLTASPATAPANPR